MTFALQPERTLADSLAVILDELRRDEEARPHPVVPPRDAFVIDIVSPLLCEVDS